MHRSLHGTPFSMVENRIWLVQIKKYKIEFSDFLKHLRPIIFISFAFTYSKVYETKRNANEKCYF